MGIWGILVSDVLHRSTHYKLGRKDKNILCFWRIFCSSECWDFIPDLLSVNSTQKQSQGFFFFSFPSCLYYFLRSHKLLSPNDTALKTHREQRASIWRFILKKIFKKYTLEANSKQLKAAAGGKWEVWQTRSKGAAGAAAAT